MTNSNYTGTWNTIFIVTLVYGLFIVSAALRIRNSWRVLHIEGVSKWKRNLRKLDLVFSGIFLTASIIFYSIFLLNMGP